MSQPEPNKPPLINIDIRMLIPMFGILFAPFVGYLISPDLGLGILVLCLGLVGWMTWGVAKQAPEPQARTLRMGAILNMVMCVAALLLLLYRL